MGLLKNITSHQVDATETLQDYGENNSWKWDKLTGKLLIHVAMKIFTIPFDDNIAATQGWKLSVNGEFNVKSVWNLVRQKSSVKPLFALIWNDRIPPSISLL